MPTLHSRSALYAPRAFPGAAPHRRADGAARSARAMGCRREPADGLRRGQGAFANRRMLAKQMGLPEGSIGMVENDVGGGFGVRGEFYPEDFLIPFARAAPAGRSSGSRTAASICSPPTMRAKRNASWRSPATATARSSALRGHASPTSAPISAPTASTAARNIAQVLSGPYRIPNIHIDVSLLLTNKTPVGHLSRAGPLRGRFLPRAAVRHRGARAGHRPRRVPPAQSDRAKREMPYRARHRRAARRSRRRPTAATIARRSIAASTEFGWTGKAATAGQADRRPLSRHRGRLLHRRRRLRARRRARGSSSKPTARCRVYVGSSGGRPGARDGVRADRRRCARNADGRDQRRVSRLDRSTCSEGFGSYSSRSIVMGGSAIVAAADKLCTTRSAQRRPQRLGCARERGRRSMTARRSGRDGRSLALARARCRGHLGRRHLRQQQAHLQLRRACRACRGRSRRPATSRCSTMSRSRTSAASSIR